VTSVLLFVRVHDLSVVAFAKFIARFLDPAFITTQAYREDNRSRVFHIRSLFCFVISCRIRLDILLVF